ncbi:MAG: HAMP domain-containing protein [Candidatus Omnitrophica bacterium]|nr:HAMP domain-containing protein [Candidatus Omnitrophota bacterium]MBU2221397.1 HAMP domain-containing protein [Candidatus Omnitrophota bacterium]
MQLTKLSAKILITITGLVLLLSVTLISTIQFTLSKELLSELQKRGIRVAKDISRQGANYILTNDILNLRILVNGYKRTDPEIAFIYVINKQGDVLVHTFKEGFPFELTGQKHLEFKTSDFLITPVFIDKIKFFNISAPILKESIGCVHVGISEASLKAVVNKTIKLITIIVLAILFIMAIVGVILSWIITRPILQLVKVAQAVGMGDLNAKVDIKSQDELGQLGMAFNQMTNDLQKTQGQLVQAAKMASIGQLAAGLAHEINNPLTGVVNNVQLIKMMAAQKPDSTISMVELNDILNAIEQAGLRCKKITQSLLDFSHASKAVFKPVSINELVENTVGLINQELKLQNIVIRVEPEFGLPLIYGNSQLLQ